MNFKKEISCPKCKSLNVSFDSSYPILDCYPAIAIYKCNDCLNLFDVELYD